MTGAVRELAEAAEWVDAVGAARVVHTLLAAHINHAELLATAVADGEGVESPRSAG